MSKQRTAILISMLLSFLAAWALMSSLTSPTAQAAPNTTITVANINNNGAGSLRQAIANASSGDTINFDNSLGGETIILSSELIITKSLTISGNIPITVSGNNATRVFNITSTLPITVTYDSLTIANGNVQTTDCGGLSLRCGSGIMIQNSNIVVIVANSTFLGNRAEGSMSYGGAIEVEDGSLTVLNSTFSGNRANYGGGIFGRFSTMTVNNATFNENLAVQGGGIYNYGTLNLSNTILANTPGATDCRSGFALASDVNNLIENNNGCGVPISNADPILGPLQDNGGNTLTYAPLSGSPAIDAGDNGTCLATDQRGIVRPQGANCDIGAYEKEVVCTIAVTSAASSGPDTLRQAISDVCAGGLIVFDASLSGSVIDISTDGELEIDKDLTISGTVPITISGNNATRVFNVTAGNIIFDSLTIANGNTQTTDCLGGAGRCGGGIMIQYNVNGIAVTVTNSALVNNTVASFGGGIFNDRGAVAVNNSSLSGNSSDMHGGGIYTYQGIVIVDDSILSDNSSNSFGGGINNDNGILTVKGSTISDNYSVSSLGGGIYSSGSLTVANSTLSGNSANSIGGGILSSATGTAMVGNSTFSYNTAGTYGGGIYSANSLTVTNSTFSGNLAGLDGGGIHNNGTLHLFNTILANASSGSDCTSIVVLASDVNNLIEVNSGCGSPVSSADPNLGPLQNNGGHTLTHAPLPGSPAIDAGDNTECLATDQRGSVRYTDGDGDSIATCEIGAVELGQLQCGIQSNGEPTVYSFLSNSVHINITNDGNDLDCLRVTDIPESHLYATGTGEGQALKTGFYWLIEGLQADGSSEATAGYSFELTLPYAYADSNSRVCRWLEGSGTGDGWDCGSDSDNSFVANTSVKRIGLDHFSDWAVGNGVGPTAVSLGSMSVIGNTAVWLVGAILALLLVSLGVVIAQTTFRERDALG